MECDIVSIERELAEMREYVERKRREFEALLPRPCAHGRTEWEFCPHCETGPTKLWR